ncbi:hypothetical protein ZYGR_0A04260 [Zygosaccharomyces rouxii]|uniref:Ribosome assembly protein 3 n=2 Tax=Zygosaccharomyces rouxii TaxID=4956 RepID=C5DQ93_ZYGRC|nr:uncharacterized protein ZYRO0A09658g [Zygosaccharomyces rouxii]KAH9198627.1 ribosome-assembly protein 3-domain-containing protein [Zygosaccharomyces rouxii]GAV46829.1 hypothetical protein ZYGR_0A04260 [Zygosaccharomyces rouxii]CAR25854.1 ZYRO0A09658p [Zygosaccharomyces rouxii]
MVESDIRAADNVAKKSRRRKKRRTTEVSDSSDSSDSSSEEETKASDTGAGEALQAAYQLSEDEDEKMPDASAKPERETLSRNTKESLNNIPFTRTELNGKSTRNNDDVSMDLQRVNEAINDAKQKIRESKEESQSTSQLKNSYLELLFENYGDDINSLRDAPDFTSNSLIMIAQVLKDGSSMFDVETLKTMLETK